MMIITGLSKCKNANKRCNSILMFTSWAFLIRYGDRRYLQLTNLNASISGICFFMTVTLRLIKTISRGVFNLMSLCSIMTIILGLIRSISWLGIFCWFCFGSLSSSLILNQLSGLWRWQMTGQEWLSTVGLSFWELPICIVFWIFSWSAMMVLGLLFFLFSMRS